jgi:hypothetical protein
MKTLPLTQSHDVMMKFFHNLDYYRSLEKCTRNQKKLLKKQQHHKRTNPTKPTKNPNTHNTRERERERERGW